MTNKEKTKLIKECIKCLGIGIALTVISAITLTTEAASAVIFVGPLSIGLVAISAICLICIIKGE